MNKGKMEQAYEALKKARLWIFSPRRFRSITGCGDAEAIDFMRSLQEKKILKKLKIAEYNEEIGETPVENDYWFDPAHRRTGSALMEILRPDDWSYVSFHSVLADVALLEIQPPTLVTATFGKNGRYLSNMGHIDFIHVENDVTDPFFYLNIYDDIVYRAKTATPELALHDYLNAGFDPSLLETWLIPHIRKDKIPDYGIKMKNGFISPFDIAMKKRSLNTRLARYERKREKPLH